MTELEWRWIFANRLSAMLDKRGLSQSEFASRMGLTDVCVSRYMNVGYSPRISTLLKMCDVLECELKDLVI